MKGLNMYKIADVNIRDVNKSWINNNYTDKDVNYHNILNFWQFYSSFVIGLKAPDKLAFSGHYFIT